MELGCAWDEGTARAWTVVGRLSERQRSMQSRRDRAVRELERSRDVIHMMTAASMRRDLERQMEAAWRGGPTVLAMLFAPPDSRPIRTLDVRGEYFDIRSGKTWDLFFPGYYQSELGLPFERQSGARPVGTSHLSNWYFGPREFDQLRQHVESCSQGRWTYSGEADLVLVNAWVPDKGPPTFDWESTVSGQLTDQAAGSVSLTLGAVVERISRDLEQAFGDANYGVGEVVDPSTPQPRGRLGRDIITNALGEIAAALTLGAIGGP